MHDEVIPLDSYTLVSDKDPWKKMTITDYRVKELQIPIFVDGKYIYEEPNIHERKRYCDSEFEKLTDRITDISNPHTYYVDLSEKERELKEYMLYETTRKAAGVAISNNGYAKTIGKRK